MNDATFERHVRDWLADREPGAIPASLVAKAGSIPYETPVPVAWRIWGAVVRPAARGGSAPGLRLALVLALVGLLVALAIGTAFVGRAPVPAPELTSWRDFVVGRTAPAIEFRSVGGPLSDTDDGTLEFEDLVGTLVVMYVPDPAARPGQIDVGGLVAATLAAPGSRAFLVAAPAEWSRAPNVDPDVVAAEPPAAWLAARDEPGPAILVVDRRGVVIAAFAATMPTEGQLARVLAGAESQQ